MPVVNQTAAEIDAFQSILLDWFVKFGRMFPWRRAGLNAYQLVIAEVLLQRTKAEVVAKHYDNFIRSFPSWWSLFNADCSSLEDNLRSLGLYKQRAKRLQALAAEMVDRDGIIPSERAELETIPLFGQYIANASELLIFNKPKPLLDVNMARLLERYFGPRKLADIRYDPYLQDLAQRVVNHSMAKYLNWAILDFSALVCRAQQPYCTNCPLNQACVFFDLQMAHYAYDNGTPPEH